MCYDACLKPDLRALTGQHEYIYSKITGQIRTSCLYNANLTSYFLNSGMGLW